MALDQSVRRSPADVGVTEVFVGASLAGYGLRIAEAVREVMAGNPVLDPALDAVPGNGAASKNPLNILSAGELRVLKEVAKGLTDKEVSNVLNLSAKTVRHALDRVFAKLRVHTRTQAAMLYAEHGKQDFSG